jgi:hypothetical protein
MVEITSANKETEIPPVFRMMIFLSAVKILDGLINDSEGKKPSSIFFIGK